MVSLLARDHEVGTREEGAHIRSMLFGKGGREMGGEGGGEAGGGGQEEKLWKEEEEL